MPTIDDMARLLAIGEFIADRALLISTLGAGNRAFVGWLDGIAQVANVPVEERCWDQHRHAKRCEVCAAAEAEPDGGEPPSEILAGAQHCDRQQRWWEAQDLVKAALYLGLLTPITCKNGRMVAMAPSHPVSEDGVARTYPSVAMGLFEVVDDPMGPLIELVDEHSLYFDQGQLFTLAGALKPRGALAMAARQAVEAGHCTPAKARTWLIEIKGWSRVKGARTTQCPDSGKRIRRQVWRLRDRVGVLHEETALKQALADAKRR